MRQTIAIPWQHTVMAAILICSGVLVAFVFVPIVHKDMKVSREFTWRNEWIDQPGIAKRKHPGEWLEFSPILFALSMARSGWHTSQNSLLPGGPLAALDLNTYNFMFLILGLLLHWRPRSFTRAVSAAVPATSGVLIQFSTAESLGW